MDTNSILEVLNNQPSIDDLLKASKRLKPHIFTPSPDTQRILACLLSTTLPEIDHTPAKVIDLFGALPGVSAILFNIKNLVRYFESSNTPASTNDKSNDLLRAEKTVYTRVNQTKLSVQASLKFFLNLLGDTLKSVPLSTIYQRSTRKSEFSELNAIFAGSSLYSLVLQCQMVLEQHISATNDSLSWDWITEKEKYGKYLSTNSSAATADTADFHFKAARLLGSSYLKHYFDSVEQVKLLLEIQSKLRDSDQKTIIISHILPYLEEQEAKSQLDPTQFASFLSLFVGQISPRSILSHLVKFAESPAVSTTIQRVIILVIAQHQSESETLFTSLLSRWASALNIQHSPVPVQHAQTHLLFFWLQQLSKQFVQTTSTSPTFLNGISNHLSALSERPRLYGMAFAEAVSERADQGQVKPLQFSSMSKSSDAELAYWRNDIKSIRDELIDTSDTNKIINEFLNRLHNKPSTTANLSIEDPVTETEDSVTATPKATNGPRITEIIDSDDEDDDGFKEFKVYPFEEDDAEDSDDDPTLVRREKLKPPMYIRGLLKYLGDESEDSVDKIELGLTHASDLIKRKAKFGKELKFHAIELASTLVGLKVNSEDDEAESESWNNMRLEALATLVACEPFTVPPHLAHLLATGDYSIMQRMVILSSITLGAHYLNGNIGQAQSESQIAKQLPRGLHEKFTTETKSKDLAPFSMKQLEDVTWQIQAELTADTREKAQDALVGGAKVLRLSNTLKRQREGFTGASSSVNLYAQLAAKHFFYPLLNQWQRLGNRMVGGAYNELFAAHYIKTLALLVHSAYPSSNDIADMSEELIRLVLSHRNIRETNTQSALYTTVLVILHVNTGEFIATKWARQVCIEIKLWLEDTWDSVPDEKARGLAASALYQIQEIGQKWERRMVSEMMGLESEGGRDIRIV